MNAEWLAGFTDGEGCFTIFMHCHLPNGRYKNPSLNLVMHYTLTQANKEMLENIKEYLLSEGIESNVTRKICSVDYVYDLKICKLKSNIKLMQLLKNKLILKKQQFEIWSQALEIWSIKDSIGRKEAAKQIYFLKEKLHATKHIHDSYENKGRKPDLKYVKQLKEFLNIPLNPLTEFAS